MKKLVTIILALAMVLSIAAPAMADWAPSKAVSAEIGYGAGGSTDGALRPLFAVAEEIIGQTIVVNNVSGASASISFASALEQPADGHTLIIGAETPCLYDAYDLIPNTYNDVEVIMVVADVYNNIFVKSDSKYQTVKDMFDAEKAAPGSVLKVASGKVGTNATIGAVFNYCEGVDFTAYTSDGSGTSVTTVLGGFADWGLGSFPTVKDYVANGDVRLLCTVAPERVDENVPSICETYPEMAQYLPINSFYTVCVKKGTDQAIIDFYTKAFVEAFNSEAYQTVCANMGLNPLGLTGEEARNYVDNWRKSALTVLTSTGAVNKTMAELGY